VKQVQGELVNESQHNQVTLALNTSYDTPHRRRLVVECAGVITVLELNEKQLVHTAEEWICMAKNIYIMIERSKLDEMTAKQLGALLA
jgi:hypothetical protein